MPRFRGCAIFRTRVIGQKVSLKIIAELRRPEGPPSGAPYSSCRGKIKETHELIFSWLSWLAVLLVGAYARRRRRRRSCPTWRPYSKNETYSLSLRFTSLILDIPAVINRPRSIYQYSSMAPRLSGQNCKFFKFLLSLNSQRRLGYKENNTKYRILTRKPRSHVRILIYRTWPIDTCQNKLSADQYHVALSRAQVYSSSKSCVFMKLTADQVLVFRLRSRAHVRLTC